MSEIKGSSWFTMEQFRRLGENCDKCEKPGTWIAYDGKGPIYCDEHWPYKEESEWKENENSK